MARLNFVKKAQKTIRGTGIKKGMSYFWYKHYRGQKVVSKEPPRRSRYSTTSPFLAGMMDAEDDFQELSSSDKPEIESFALSLRGIAETVEQLGDDCESSADNMESAFPNGCPTIELLRERKETCDRIKDEIEAAISDIEAIDTSELNEDEVQNEISDAVSQVNWEYA